MIRYILLTLFPFLTYSQNKIIILDIESRKPISGATIVAQDFSLNTNEDGYVDFSEINKSVLISAPQYESLSLEKINNDTIFLKPRYNEIEEVILKKIDFYDIIVKTLDNYDKNYNAEFSLFKGAYKDKLKISNKINSLFVAEISVWTKDNQFDFTSNIEKFLQLSVDKIKYNKSDNSNLNFRNFSNEKSVKAFTTRLFLNGYLIILKKALHGVNINTKITNTDKESQYVEFVSNGSTKEGISFRGNFIYDTEDKVITHIVIEQNQDNSSKRFSSENDKFKLFTNHVIVTYDFYKKDKLYLPSYVIVEQKGNVEQKGKNLDFWRTRKIDFISHQKSSQKLLSKLDINKDIIVQIPNSNIKDTKTLLSAEEQKFVDEP